MNISISNTGTFSINRPILMSIYNYPSSGFVKINNIEIKLLSLSSGVT